MEPSVLSTAAYRETAPFSLKGAAPMNLNWKTILKKAGIILLSTLLFALCSGLLYITKMAGSINITRPEDEPELASAMTNENLDTETREKLGGYWTIAVFGVDSRNGKLGKENNADVQMLCSINRDTGEIRLVSLYRDTFLMNDTANSGYGKLNQSYFLQGPSGNISAINTNLDMKVEDFVSFNWNSAADAINLLGGVDIELSKAEFYYINAFITETVNITGIPSTHLEGPGMQHLDGVQAVAYMRLRQMDTDFKRTERQRSVIEQVFDNARKADISTLIQVFHTVAPQIMTSISEEEFMDIAYNIKNYHINGTAGFPFEQTTASLGKIGSVVIPSTLESNVEELHRFLYDDDDYICSGPVRDISREIIKRAVKN